MPDFFEESWHRYIQKENNVRHREMLPRSAWGHQKQEWPFEGAMFTFTLTSEVCGSLLWELCKALTSFILFPDLQSMYKIADLFQTGWFGSNSSKLIRFTCSQQRCQLLTTGHSSSLRIRAQDPVKREHTSSLLWRYHSWDLPDVPVLPWMDEDTVHACSFFPSLFLPFFFAFKD